MTTRRVLPLFSYPRHRLYFTLPRDHAAFAGPSLLGFTLRYASSSQCIHSTPVALWLKEPCCQAENRYLYHWAAPFYSIPSFDHSLLQSSFRPTFVATVCVSPSFQEPP